jgi:hypothetical protein
MKHTAFILIALCSLAWSLHPQQAAFVNTIQDFKSRVIDFREDGLTGCIREGVLVNPSPADLKAGDVFIDIDGNAKKVAKVTLVGTDLYVDTVQPNFEDVFLYAEIPPQVIAFNGDNFLPGTLAGSRYSAASSGGTRGTFDVSFEKEIYNKPPALVKINADAVLTSNISIGFKAPTYVQIKIRTWKFWEWRISFSQVKGYIQGSFDYNLALTGGINFSLEKSMESKPVLLYGFGTPTSGIAANLGLMTKTILEGSLALSLPVTVTVSGNAGARCTLEGQVPVMWPTDMTRWGSTNYSVEITPSLTAEAALKQKLYLGADITIVGIKITEFEAGGGPYIKVNGTLEGSIGYSSATGLIGPSWSASATGEIGVFFDISGKVFDGKWSVTIFSREFPIFTLFEASTGAAFRYPAGRPRIPFLATVEGGSNE